MLTFYLIIIPCLLHHHHCPTSLPPPSSFLCSSTFVSIIQWISLIFFSPFLVGKIIIRAPWLVTSTLNTAATEAAAFAFSRSLLYLIWPTHFSSIWFFYTACYVPLQSSDLIFLLYSYLRIPIILLRSYLIFLLHSTPPRFSSLSFTPFRFCLLCSFPPALPLWSTHSSLINSDHSYHDPFLLLRYSLLTWIKYVFSARSALLCLLLLLAL